MIELKIKKLINSIPINLRPKLLSIASTIEFSEIPENHIGLLTLDDALKKYNADNKNHGDVFGHFDLKKLNRDIPISTDSISILFKNKYQKLYIENFNNGSIAFIISDGEKETLAVVYKNLIYYTDDSFFKIFNIFVPLYADLAKEKVKYLDKYIELINDTSEKNKERYKIILQNYIINEKKFQLRAEKIPKKDFGQRLVITNEDNLVVAFADDEWGATLLAVAKEYRSLGLGSKIKDYWSSTNPSYVSGGFSDSGLALFEKYWADGVSFMLSRGLYSEAIKNGLMTKELVDKILEQYKKIRPTSLKKEPPKREPETKEILIYCNETLFVIYDKKFMQSYDDKYIFGYGFLKSGSVGEFVYTIDYTEEYAELSERIIIQCAKNNGIKYLYNGEGYSDFMSLKNISEISTEMRDTYSGSTQQEYIKINGDTYSALKSESIKEARFRTASGVIIASEMESMLIEAAESKDW